MPSNKGALEHLIRRVPGLDIDLQQISHEILCLAGHAFPQISFHRVLRRDDFAKQQHIVRSVCDRCEVSVDECEMDRLLRMAPAFFA